MFVCSILSGSPPLTFIWLKNGVSLTESDNIKITNDDDLSVLTIKSVKYHNNGNYTCLVKNPQGSDEYTAPLFIKGKVAIFVVIIFFTQLFG